jgi:hypothetical protein
MQEIMEFANQYSWLEHWAWLFTAIGAVVAFWFKVVVDRRKAVLQRFNKFQQMRKRTDEGPLSKTFNIINRSDPAQIAQLKREEKEEFLAFYEEIALMVNSGLLGKELALYMFGAWARVAVKPKSGFWSGGLQTTDPYWSLAVRFCQWAESEGDPDLSRYRRRLHCAVKKPCVSKARSISSGLTIYLTSLRFIIASNCVAYRC